MNLLETPNTFLLLTPTFCSVLFPGSPCLCHGQCLKLAQFNKIQRQPRGFAVLLNHDGVGTGPGILLVFFQEFPTHRTVLSTLLASLPFCPSESGMLQGQVCIFCTEAREDMVKAYTFSQQTSTGMPHTMPGSQDPELNETQLLTSGGSQSSRDLATKQQQFWPLWASWSGMSP